MLHWHIHSVVWDSFARKAIIISLSTGGHNVNLILQSMLKEAWNISSTENGWQSLGCRVFFLLTSKTWESCKTLKYALSVFDFYGHQMSEKRNKSEGPFVKYGLCFCPFSVIVGSIGLSFFTVSWKIQWRWANPCLFHKSYIACQGNPSLSFSCNIWPSWWPIMKCVADQMQLWAALAFAFLGHSLSDTSDIWLLYNVVP